MSMSISGVGGGAPQIYSGASMRTPPAQKMANLFQQIDTGNTGSISKAQFGQAFQTMNPPASFKSLGADAVFSKLDPNHTGSVSKQNFVSGMTSMMSQLRQSHQAGSQVDSFAQTLSNSVDTLNNLGTTGTGFKTKA